MDEEELLAGIDPKIKLALHDVTNRVDRVPARLREQAVGLIASHFLQRLGESNPELAKGMHIMGLQLLGVPVELQEVAEEAEIIEGSD